MPEIKAVFFDQDGVIIDTEKDGHRVAFNRTFREFGYAFEWDVEYYHEMLQVAGGKERMKHHLDTKGFGVDIRPEEVDDLIKSLHRRKTEIIAGMLENGELPLRPGVKRLMQEINEAGLILAITTTTNERSANIVAGGILKGIDFDFILAGDVVSRKKPDPEIYHLALEKSGLQPEECLVIEDSYNGVTAAHAAGMNVVATTNFYTEREDLSKAAIIVTILGDPDGEKGKLLKAGEGLVFDGVLYLDALRTYFSQQDS